MFDANKEKLKRELTENVSSRANVFGDGGK
jgi:hypothetical protein